MRRSDVELDDKRFLVGLPFCCLIWSLDGGFVTLVLGRSNDLLVEDLLVSEVDLLRLQRRS